MTEFKIELGATVVDNITGFCGKVIGAAEYLTGCRQYCIAPYVKEDGDFRESRWFDEDRLTEQKRAASPPPPSNKGGPQLCPAPAK